MSRYMSEFLKSFYGYVIPQTFPLSFLISLLFALCFTTASDNFKIKFLPVIFFFFFFWQDLLLKRLSQWKSSESGQIQTFLRVRHFREPWDGSDNDNFGIKLLFCSWLLSGRWVLPGMWTTISQGYSRAGEWDVVRASQKCHKASWSYWDLHPRFL